MADFFVNVWAAFGAWFSENIIAAFKTIGFTDILDIFALAGVFYFLYRFARKRRAMRLVFGVVMFFFVMFIVDAMHLTALKFVFGDFKQLGVIAILIIFQPELRSALEKIGGTTFMGLQNIKSSDKNNVNSQYVIESVSRAAQKLASDQHGALMVIEREQDLSDFKQGGTTLDAVVSPDTLCSIFYKGGALHDGAVIIHEGRIAAAGCVLGMTTRTDIDSSLGTRHRAAIGTSETSDAIVVVVSEETGNISIAINGELERGYNYSTLRERLEQLMSNNHKAKNEKTEQKNDAKA